MCVLNGTEWYYEAMFSHDMPDLNLDNPALRLEIEKIMKFWYIIQMKYIASKIYYDNLARGRDVVAVN